MSRKKMHEKFLSMCDNGFILLDSDYCIIETNKAVSVLTGLSRSELEGVAIDLLFDSFTVAKIHSAYSSCGCSELERTFSGELLVVTGPVLDVQISVNCTIDEEKEHLWLIIKNGSSSIEIEEKLRKSRLMLSTALESLPFDFWINDAENHTYMQNSISKALWGDVKGTSPDEVGADPLTTKKWLETTKRALAGEVVKGEIEYLMDGRRKIYRNIIAPIKDDDQVLGIVGMNIDISDLKEALEVRDMLLKEVHHRVKNNLQMISGIIRLESENLCSDADREVTDQIINRIEAVSLVHEKLYQAGINRITHISDYIRDLVDYIVSGVNVENIIVDYDLDDIELSPDDTIIIGLIINELVTNSVKYAFNRSGRHVLSVGFKKKGESAEILVSDNGPGIIEKGEAFEGCASPLGFRMMDVFAQQLGGKVTRNSSSSGVVSSISFPVKKTGV